MGYSYLQLLSDLLKFQDTRDHAFMSTYLRADYFHLTVIHNVLVLGIALSGKLPRLVSRLVTVFL
uniref:Uncharacterized protein n=1 Tax=Arundo donax TaxID=35708 RepID=A0A0A9D8N5_ARUDO